MTDPTGLSVGQEVWLYSRYGHKEPRRAKITKIGRLLVELDGYGPKFRIASGRINDDFGAQWFKTDEQRLEYDRRSAALDMLRAAGLEFRFGAAGQLSADQMERIAAIASEVPRD